MTLVNILHSLSLPEEHKPQGMRFLLSCGVLVSTSASGEVYDLGVLA